MTGGVIQLLQQLLQALPGDAALHPGREVHGVHVQDAALSMRHTHVGSEKRDDSREFE